MKLKGFAAYIIGYRSLKILGRYVEIALDDGGLVCVLGFYREDWRELVKIQS